MSDIYPAIRVTESSADACESWNRTFVRPVDGVEGGWLKLAAPFNTIGGSGGGSQLPVRWPRRGKWLFTVALSNHRWAPSFSNAADGLALFEANLSSRRHEIVVVGYDSSDKGWFFWMNRAGKQAVRFQWPAKFAEKRSKAKFKSVDFDSGILSDCGSGRAAVEKLCRYFEVNLYGCRLLIVEDRPNLVDADGTSLNAAVIGYEKRDGYALELGEDRAADALHMAILQDDESALRDAVAAGARLDVLAGRSLTPLQQAVARSGSASGERCAAALVELGALVDGDGSEEPPLCWCRERPGQVKLLLSLGANVNAIDPQSGRTALFSLVADSSRSEDRNQSIRLLLEQGANPAIPDRSGQTVIDWLQTQISRQKSDVFGFKAAQQYQETLSLITGLEAEELHWRKMTRHSTTVRPELAECVRAASPDLDPDARFFGDLGGSQRALRTVAMRVSNRLQAPFLPVLSSACAILDTDVMGRPTAGSLTRLEEFLPGWHQHSRPERFQDVLTVSMLEAVADRAAKSDSESLSTTDNPVLVQRYVRQRFAELTGTPLKQLTPKSMLSREPSNGVPPIAALVASAQEYFGVDCGTLLREVEQQLEFDSNSRLSAAACERVVSLLPTLDATFFGDLTVDDVLFSLAGIESIVQAACMRRPRGNIAKSPIIGDFNTWVRDLASRIGDRRYRLLLAGACRYALDEFDLTRKEVVDALGAFEEWAETGTRETAVRDAHRRFRGAWIDSRRTWRNQPDYTALNKLMSLDDAGVLEDVLHALVKKHKISGTQAEVELDMLAQDLTPPPGTPEFDPGWRRPEVQALAATMYESRDFRQMFQLADALQRAGCTDKSILNHCRDPLQVHLRGCWLVDRARESPAASS